MSLRGSIVLGFAAVLAAGPIVAPATRAGELTDSVFQKLREELQPGPEEPWRTIPWKIALLDAQQAAAQQQKPIFIWAMDGHPLGCT